MSWHASVVPQNQNGVGSWQQDCEDLSGVTRCGPAVLTQPAGNCRDLKTSNVLLTAEGVAKISDVRVATGLGAEERLSDATPARVQLRPDAAS